MSFSAKGLVWLLPLVACATTKEPISLMSYDDIKAEDYQEVLRQWTRTEKVYDMLDRIVFVNATFHSPAFRRAFLLQHPNVYGRGSEEARRLALTSEGAEEQLEFFFSASTGDIRWNDFDRDDSIWRVTLQGDEGELVDGNVVRLKTTANLRVIYPYITPFARTYAIRFPRSTSSGQPVLTSASKRFVLRVSSALGEAELVWDLIPASRG